MYHSSFSCRVGDIHIAHKYAKKIKASVHPNATGDSLRYLPELEGFAVGVPVMVNRGVIRPSKFVVTAVFNDLSPFVIAIRSTQFTATSEESTAVQLMPSASMNIPVAAGSATVSARYTEGPCSIVSNQKICEFL